MTTSIETMNVTTVRFIVVNGGTLEVGQQSIRADLIAAVSNITPNLSKIHLTSGAVLDSLENANSIIRKLHNAHKT